MTRVYTYVNCDTCRKAVKWLEAVGITFEQVPIRETPPTTAELRKVLASQGGDLRRLLNVSGQAYRSLGLKDKIGGMTSEEAIAMLSENGNLVKRPFVVLKDGGLVGFQEEVWRGKLLA